MLMLEEKVYIPNKLIVRRFLINNIEVDIRVKCIENRLVQVQLVETIGTK